MFRIGEFSKMSKTTIKTLRYYDETGLLAPGRVDAFTGYRFYSTHQLAELHRIQAYRQIGLSIDEIKLIQSGYDPARILENRRTELLAEVDEKEDQLSRIEFILSGKEEEFMNYQGTIKQVPECIVYSKKMTVPNYEAYFKIIPELGEQVMKKYPDLKCAVPEYCFIIYLAGEYKEKDIDIEYCEAVDKMKEDFDGICFKKMEAITVLSVMHKGAYRSLSQAYTYAFRWAEENGYCVTGSPRESYIDGIWNKDSEEDWLTELQVPVEKIK